MGAPRSCRGAFVLNARNRYSSGVTGGSAGAAGFSMTAGALVCAGAFCGAADSGSTDPAVSCGADDGRLRGTGGRPGVTAADLAAGRGWAYGCTLTCGGCTCGAMTDPGGA